MELKPPSDPLQSCCLSFSNAGLIIWATVSVFFFPLNSLDVFASLCLFTITETSQGQDFVLPSGVSLPPTTAIQFGRLNERIHWVDDGEVLTLAVTFEWFLGHLNSTCHCLPCLGGTLTSACSRCCWDGGVRSCSSLCFLCSSLFLRFISLYVMCFCVWVSGHYLCAWCLQRVEEGVDPLELKLQTVTSCYVGTGNWNQVLWKSSTCLASWVVDFWRQVLLRI